MRIALAQSNCTVGDLTGNAKKALELGQKALNAGADLIAFPELFLTGYPPEDLLFKPQFLEDQKKILEETARLFPKIAAVMGFVHLDRSRKIYNAAAVIYQSKICGIYHKHQLPNYGVFDEKRYFSEGRGNLLISLQTQKKENQTHKMKDIGIGLSICEDIWIPNGPCWNQAKSGASILLNISSSPYHAGKIHERQKLLSSLARKSHSWVCYVNLVGGQDELVFDGGSLVLNPHGRLYARGPQFEESLLLIDIDAKPRPKKIRRTDRILSIPLSSKEKPPIKIPRFPVLSSNHEIFRALSLGTRDYCLKNNFKSVILGLSGGIDSSLVACIAAEAVGPEHVHAVSMPSRYSSNATQSDAARLAANLGIQFSVIPIENIFHSFLHSLAGSFKGTQPNITEENLQARIRGTILMALSNKFGHLVLTTGNKSEMAVGYATLYGDMAGGFAVLKDIPKMLVYQLSHFVNHKEDREMILKTIIDRPPTAELRPHQKDEDSLPPYPVLDRILLSYVEEEKSQKQIIKAVKEENIVKKILYLIDHAEYKRRQSPPGIKITPKAFGRDRRMPIVNHYKP